MAYPTIAEIEKQERVAFYTLVQARKAYEEASHKYEQAHALLSRHKYKGAHVVALDRIPPTEPRPLVAPEEIQQPCQQL